MRMTTTTIPAAILAIIPFLPLVPAQTSVAPTDGEQVGPAAGETFAKYNVTAILGIGLQVCTQSGGDDGKYRK